MQNETGNAEFQYELACTEVCGRGHFAMKMIMIVEEPEDYNSWVAEQSKKTFASNRQATPAAEGAEGGVNNTAENGAVASVTAQ